MIQTNLTQRPTSSSFFGGIRDAISSFGRRPTSPAQTAQPTQQTGFPTRDVFTAKPGTSAQPAPARTAQPAGGKNNTSFFQNLLSKFLNTRLGKTGFGKAIGIWMHAMSMSTKPLLPPPNTFGAGGL